MSSYLDINDILGEEQKITCQFRYDAYNLGQLEEGSRDSDMKKGTMVDLPYWMSFLLAKKQFVSVVMPENYQEEYKNKLKADPTVISMRNFPYYDKIGVQLGSFFNDKHLKELLFDVFRTRFCDIYNKSLNLRETDITKILGNMTYQERLVFEHGYKSSIEYDKWRNRKGEKIEKISNSLLLPSSSSNKNNSNSSSDNSNNNKSTTTAGTVKENKKRKRMFDDN